MSASTPDADPDQDQAQDADAEDSGGVQDVYAWVLQAVEERTSPDDPWSSEGALRQARHTMDFDRDAVDAAIDTAVANDDLLDWHGLFAPATLEGIQAVIEAEADADITRQLLVKKANRLKRRIQE